MSKGFITVHRKITESSWYGKPDYVALWIHMLMLANHKERDVMIGNQIITVKRGQFISGRKALAKKTGVQEAKVNRIISVFKTQQQIEQQAFSKFSLFSIVNYRSYQDFEQQSEQQTNSKRTANEQQVNTNNNVNNVNNDIRGDKPPAKKAKRFTPPTVKQVTDYCKERKNNIDAQKFVDFYSTSNWMRGKNKIKDWKACVRTWENNETKAQTIKFSTMSESALLAEFDNRGWQSIGLDRWSMINKLEAAQ